MLNFGPNPKNRLYTNLNSYLTFLSYILADLFEKKLSERFSSDRAICVYQCRLGIYLAVKALIKPGQEVILSPYTIVDVINMVIFAGGRPVFADVDRLTCNISVAEVERLITPNTGAVLITHLHGLAAEAHRIKEICDRSNIPIIEDAAQSFGVKEQGKPVGTIGDVGVFSFEMHKNVPTWLGGVVVTNRQDQKVKKGLIHDLASIPVLFQFLTYPLLRFSYLNNVEFINSRVRRKPQESKPTTELPDIYKSQFTPLQASLGLSQIKNVDRDIKTRIEYAHIYYEGLKDIDGLIMPPIRADGSHTYLWFPVLYSQRDDLIRYMFEQGRDIAAGHFTSTADSPRFEEFYRDCPNSKKVEKELLYLPTYPRYSRHEVEKNIEVIRKYFASKSTSTKEQVKELVYEA
jgi:perosamine synthetase